MVFMQRPSKKTGVRRIAGSGAGIKYPYLWLSMILFLLATIGLFSSRAQSLFLAGSGRTAELKPPDTLPENPVYGPLARSVHFRNAPSSPEKPAPKGGPGSLEPSLSWTGWSEAEWWIPEDQALTPEAYWMRGSTRRAPAGRSLLPDLLPELRNRDIDPQAVMSNYIAMGVVDLLDDLREPSVEEGVPEQENPPANPFEKALSEAVDEGGEAASEVEPEKVQDNVESVPPESDAAESDSSESDAVESDAVESDSSESDVAESDSSDSDTSNNEESNSADKTTAGGGGASADCNLLFIGSFGDKPLATAIGAVQPNLLHQSLNRTVFIDLDGAGKQDLDIDVVLRDRDRQESVAFGDLDLDGFIDLVMTDQITHLTYIFKNDRRGNYEPAGEIDGGLGPTAAVISDFNADDSPDIAVVLRIQKRIIVDGKGLRRLIYLPTSPIAGEFTSMVPYDFDDDGLMDLLLSNYQDFSASTYLNQGNGRFAASDSFALQDFPCLQARIDLDGDGVEEDVYIQSLGDNISVAMMNGKDGTISNLGNMTLDPSLCFVLGDFNMDGIVDIALAHRK